jgi:hypothetical protein
MIKWIEDIKLNFCGTNPWIDNFADSPQYLDSIHSPTRSMQVKLPHLACSTASAKRSKRPIPPWTAKGASGWKKVLGIKGRFRKLVLGLVDRSKVWVMTLSEVTGETTLGLSSTLLLLQLVLLLQLPAVETSLSSSMERDTFLLLAADAHFRRCISSSGLPRTKDGCAYISVSGPRRTLEKPYWKTQRTRIRRTVRTRELSQEKEFYYEAW